MGSFGAYMASQVEDYKRIVAAKDAEITQLRADLDETRKIVESSFDQANRIASMVNMSQWPRNQARSLSNFLFTIADMTSSAVRDLAASRTALAAYQSPEAALSLALKAIEESQRANRAEAALAKEREALTDEARGLRLGHTRV